MSKKSQIKLSPTSLNLFLECPRCFWLEFNKKIERPEGPFSTLPGGMDYTLKNHYDNYRKEGLPPELQGKLPGRLLSNDEKIKEFRRDNKISVSDDVFFSGKLDDVLELDDGTIIPLDNKTRGYPLKEIHQSLGIQMSSYTYILRESGYKTKNLAYLVYWFLDHKNMDFNYPLKFNISVEEVETEPDRIKQEILRAVDCLKGEILEPGKQSGEKGDKLCPYCEYHNKLISEF